MVNLGFDNSCYFSVAILLSSKFFSFVADWFSSIAFLSLSNSEAFLASFSTYSFFLIIIYGIWLFLYNVCCFNLAVRAFIIAI